jgi:hypothetical protein
LTLGNLPVTDSIGTISSILQIPSTNGQLHDFLSANSFFTYKEKHVQITHKTYQEYEIFVFIKLDASVLSVIFKDFKEANKITKKDIEIPISELLEEENSEILEYFEKNHNVKAMGYTLYKGIPLISDNIVLQTYNNLLVVKIEDKQMISSKVNAQWIIQTQQGMTFEAVVQNTNNSKKLIFLSKAKIIQTGFHKRELIRYELNPSLPILLSLANGQISLDVIDISENSLKALTDNATILEAINNEKIVQASIKLKDETIHLSCKFLREGNRYDQKAEVIFSLTLDNNASTVLKKWLNKQQMKLIREIRDFQK